MFAQLIAKRQTGLSNPAPWLYDILGGQKTTAGVRINEQTALQITTVWACVKVLAGATAQLPLNLFRDRGDRKERAVRHPLQLALNLRPNPEMTAFTWREMSMVHLLTWGNAYSIIRRNRLGQTVELLPLLPDRTIPRRVEGQLVYDTVINEKSFSIPAVDILHLRGMGNDGLVGWSPIRAQMEHLGWMKVTQEHSSRFFANGANVRGVLMFPGKIDDMARLKQEWNSAYQGSDNANQTAVLERGMEYKPIGIPPEEAQFIQTRNYQRSEVAAFYQVPLHFLGDPNTKYNNREHEDRAFVVHSLGQWLVRIEQEIRLKLLLPVEQKTMFVKFNVNAYMRGDNKTQAEWYTKMVTNGIMTRNEVRELEDMDPIEGLDEPLTPANMNKSGDESDAEPAAESPPDADADDQAARVMRQAAVRVARKENGALARFAKRGPEWKADVADWYAGEYGTFLANNLAMTQAQRARYLDTRWLAIEQATDAESAKVDPAALIEAMQYDGS